MIKMTTETTTIRRHTDTALIGITSVAAIGTKFALTVIATPWSWALWLDTDEGDRVLKSDRQPAIYGPGDGLYANAAAGLRALQEAQAQTGFFRWRPDVPSDIFS